METKKHFKETYKILRKLDRQKLSNWMMQSGYYPESYVLPPYFRVDKFQLLKKEIYQVNKNGTGYKYGVNSSKLLNISFPNSHLTDREFGIIHPSLYHDIVFNIVKNWDFIVDHLFKGKRKIFSYSFPVPITSKSKISTKRQERMIYEYIEMAEKDLLIDSINFKYVVHIDIKNFYPSIYTHSIPWALHGHNSRKPKNYSEFGHKLDKLFHYANDRCTNGIPIGPVVSDLIAEIILSSIDKSVILPKGSFGVRFKDDYRILCKTKSEGSQIIKNIQKELKKFNLHINESKTDILELPDGLFRPWIVEYASYSFRGRKISLKEFGFIYSKVIQINKKYPSKGIIDKFLGEIVSNDNFDLNVILKTDKDRKKFISLVWSLARVRPKSFASILGIIEYFTANLSLKKYIELFIKNDFIFYSSDDNEDVFMAIWLHYFMKTNCIKAGVLGKKEHDFWEVLRLGKKRMFSLPLHEKCWSFYEPIKGNKKFGTINENVILFQG
ncbi:RNA-directed DNA polymerase [Patescibacteria group bacterium]